jgi:N-acetylmuramoyl-L-alanine amidase/Putative peptidoglycan binding domain
VAHTFIPSPFFNETNGRKIDLIVIHTMEMAEKPDTAEGCARWFQNPTAEVSAHYCVDNNSVVQCVHDKDIAWHARGGNHNSLGIEHAGTAKQTGRQWNDEYSQAMLERSATLTAELCKKHKVPPVWLFPADLRAGKRGITSHKNVSAAFKKGNHWDPGEGFRVERYITMVRKEMGVKVKPDTPPEKIEGFPRLQDDPPILRAGSSGWQVKRLQTLLNEAGFDAGEEDGKFGPNTERAVKELQRASDLDPDGIAGPLTWRAVMNVEAKAHVREPAHA